MTNSIDKRYRKLKAKLKQPSEKEIFKEAIFTPYEKGQVIIVPPDRHKLTSYQIREARKRWATKKTCSICCKKFKSERDRHVDHCHVTGVIRGLLCFSCNMALGHFKDDISILKSALEYLEYFKYNPDFVDQDLWSEDS
jgi:Recombination endonuclease VII